MGQSVLFIFRVILGALFGYFLPGYLLAGALCARGRVLWSFPLSLVLLFLAILGVQVAGLPITVPAVATVLFLACVGFLVLRRVVEPPIAPESAKHTTPPDGRWLRTGLACGCGVLVVMILLRTTLWPLSGWDTVFRWDFLAQRILERRSLNFYPPISAEDFRYYFDLECVPPMVSFSYWWLYAVSGGHFIALTGILVAAQVAWVLGFTWAIGRSLHSSSAGIFAAAILGSSMLFIRSVSIGQEAGLTTLAMAAMLCALVESRQGHDWRGMLLAGLAAALGAICREYCCVLPILGAIAVLWMGGGFKKAMLLCGIALIAGGPWYLREIIRTGNPFYSLRFGPFAVNPVYAALFDYYSNRIGVGHWKLQQWVETAVSFLRQAPMQITLGSLAGIVFFRKLGFLAAAAGTFVALWLYSIKFALGGAEVNMRVAAPAMVPLSVLSAILLARLPAVRIMQPLVSTMMAIGLIWGIIVAGVHPFYPTLNTLRYWFVLTLLERDSDASDRYASIPKLVPPQSRILSEDDYLHASLYGSNIDILPVWSPEVRFIADNNLSPLEVRRRLLALGIGYVMWTPMFDGDFLTEYSRFYREDQPHWRTMVESSGKYYLYELPDESRTSAPGASK
jgi:hypothetical protein